MESRDQFYINNVLAGDNASFAPLIDQYKNMVFTLALKIVKCREDAEEVAQDSFVKAFQNLDSFKGESKFSTWLYSIVYRTAISKVRNKKIDLTDIDKSLYKIQENSLNSDPLETMKFEEQREYVRRAIDQLPEIDALLVTLFYLNENSIEEIERITGLGHSNVKTRLFRARKKLHDSLKSLLNHEMKSIV